MALLGCQPLLKDPSGHFWALSCIDDPGGNGGLLTTTAIGIPILHQAPPILSTGARSFALSADIFGDIVAAPFVPPTLQPPMTYIPLVSDGGLSYALTIVEPDGLLQLAPTTTLLPDFIPYIPDVSMSKWPDSIGVFCASCGNATVTVSADLSCWCCTCSTFVPPEDTNIIVILEE